MPTLISAGADSNVQTLSVNFRVSVSLSTGKATVHLSNKAEGSTVHPYNFYCGTWMGGANSHLSFHMLNGCSDGRGETTLTLSLQSTDTDMFKCGVYVLDPETNVCRHLASGFETLDWLSAALSEAKSFSESKRSLLLKDNYSKNQALLHFCNINTDVKVFNEFRQKLKPSVLHNNEDINKKVLEMSFGLHNWIEHSANVSSRNGGQNFVNPVCFTEAQGCVINYPLLNMTYSSERHRAPLRMLTYVGLSTVHYVGMSVENLLKLSDSEYVNNFIVPLCTSFTVCPVSSVYAGDKTLDADGGLDSMTENFAMVLSSHLYTSLRSSPIFRDRFHGMLQKMSVDELSTHYTALSTHPDPGSAAHHTIADDCETLTGLIKSFDGAILQYHLKSVEEYNKKSGVQIGAPAVSGENSTAHDSVLGQMMWDCTRGMQNLASVPLQDFMSLGQLLGRYGRLQHNASKGVAPFAQIGLCIVSAKGPSFSKTNSELNGHACAVAQTVTTNGSVSYTIAEGTSNMTMKDLPAGCLKSVVLPLTIGEKSFGTMEALEIIGVSMGELTATCGKTRVGQFIPHTFKDSDPYVSCPFYMAGFFMGLEMNSCTPGVIPLDTKRGPAFVCGEAGRDLPGVGDKQWGSLQPVFGAPVAALADDAVRALPINLANVMGEKEALGFLGTIKARNDETYIPRLSDENVCKLIAPWGPVLAFDAATAARHDPTKTWICSCAEAFDNADMLRTVFELKRRLADKFNEIQSRDLGDDGIRMVVQCHMLSVVCHFHVPLPTQEKWQLSCARNMKLATSELPLPKKSTVSIASKCDVGSKVVSLNC